MSLDLSSFRLNSPLGKRILAATREGNYAHPGEEEAIVKTLEPFSQDPFHHWLDAGCGRGGTAAFIQKRGWASVTAFDIDAISIAEARTNYPEITFHECSVTDTHQEISDKFDLIYSFNAFYAFPDQPKALTALRNLANDAGKLIIFDYINRGGFYEAPLTRLAEGAHWRPVEEASIGDQMRAAGWELDSIQNLDTDYERWYQWLVARFDTKREHLLTIAPPELIDHTRNFYSLLLDAIRQGALGGGIFLARAMPASRE
ncbi:hypothetical protein BH09VER1_BH09VER1_40910 [soil metagenome]